jgi:glycosyltransferase involved in cell wall biosynthesis
MMRPVISLVSGTFNRLPLLMAMVNSFRSNLMVGIPYEIVLIDGGSSDGTIEWAKQQRDVKLIEDGKLLGAISAFTRGAFAASGKTVLIANDDITFHRGSILPALIHLEDHMQCGAVAFRDNRPQMAHHTRDMYKVSFMPAVVHGRLDYVKYAQVGLFRKWLGDKVHWWMGEHDEMEGARTYAGDNCLSAHIWKHGFTVDEVEACAVDDTIIEDELRAINREAGKNSNDSEIYYRQFPGEWRGPVVPEKPTIDQVDHRAARILHLPIYEPGWERNQKDPVCGKHGLVEALARHQNKSGENCIVIELDYMHEAPDQLQDTLVRLCQEFRPDLVLTQFQAPGIQDAHTGRRYGFAEMLAAVRSHVGSTIVNWNGDQWEGGLTSPEIMPMLNFIDLQLVVNLDVAPKYEAAHVRWAYWQNSFEDPQGDLEAQIADFERRNARTNPFEGYPESIPVVFLGMLRSERRNLLASILQKHGGRVYTPGDGYDTLYNFPKGKFIYNRAKLCVSDNEFPDCKGFVSNRLMQALGAGGALVLQEHVAGLDEVMGIQDRVHYVKFNGLEDLDAKISYWLQPEHEAERARIAQTGCDFMHEHHSFDQRVDQLFALMKAKLDTSKQLAEWVALKPRKADQQSTGLGSGQETGIRYEYQQGRQLMVHRKDVEGILHLFKDQFEVVDG